MNTLYKSVYNRNWVDDRKSLADIREMLEAQLSGLIRSEQKRRQPRQRKIFDDLPPGKRIELVEEIKASRLWEEHDRLRSIVDAEEQRRESLLGKYCEKVTHKPLKYFNRLKVVSSYGYSSQGYGAIKYAEGTLFPLKDRLESLGYETHVSKSNIVRSSGTFSVDHCDCVLWGNCEPWAFDAAKRSLTLSEMIESFKSRQLNPLVYNPSLPDWCRL